MLAFNPEERIKANEALEHEWFIKMKKKINKKDSVCLTKTLNDL